MTIEKTGNNLPENEPRKKFIVEIEMEGYGVDGEEITGGDLWERVEVEAIDEDEADDIVFNKMDFGNRMPTGYSEIREATKPKEEQPFQGVRLGGTIDK